MYSGKIAVPPGGGGIVYYIYKICKKKNIFAKRMLFTYVQIVTHPNKYFFYTWDQFYFILNKLNKTF
jgi:hypothetical protein